MTVVAVALLAWAAPIASGQLGAGGMAGSPAFAATDPSVIPAVALPENSGQYFPWRVNARGDVLVKELLPPTQYAISGDHGLVLLPDLVGPGGPPFVEPTDLNEGGLLVGEASDATPLKQPIWVDLGTLGGGVLDHPAGSDTRARFVGDDGTIAGWVWDPTGGEHLVVWDGPGGAMRRLERPGAVWSNPIDIDDQGHVLAYEDGPAGTSLLLWDAKAGTAVEVPTTHVVTYERDAFLSDDLLVLIRAVPPGEPVEVVDLRSGTSVSYPEADRCGAISPGGMVVCSGDELTLRDPRTGSVTVAGRPPGSTLLSLEPAVNRRGQVVTHAEDAAGDTHAWLWDPIQGFNELLLPAPGAASPSISEDGRVVGSGPTFRTGWITPPLTPTAPATATATARAAGVEVRWDAGAADPAVGLFGYRVWRDGTVIGDTAADVRRLVDPDAGSGAHRYEVRALTRAAGSSAIDASVQVPPTQVNPIDPAPPAVPVVVPPRFTG